MRMSILSHDSERASSAHQYIGSLVREFGVIRAVAHMDVGTPKCG